MFLVDRWLLIMATDCVGHIQEIICISHNLTIYDGVWNFNLGTFWAGFVKVLGSFWNVLRSNSQK